MCTKHTHTVHRNNEHELHITHCDKWTEFMW